MLKNLKTLKREKNKKVNTFLHLLHQPSQMNPRDALVMSAEILSTTS